MATVSDQFDYKYIFDYARNGYYFDAARVLFDEAGLTFPAIDKKQDDVSQCSKAFWIALAVDKYGDTYQTDIVLYALGLLDGYYGMGAEARRLKYFIESNYKGKKADTAFLMTENKTLSEQEIKSKANALYKTENPLLEDLIKHFFTIKDKNAFFRSACDRYLEYPDGSSRVREVRLPKPRYSVEFHTTVNNLPQRNELFIGREDILDILEQGFAFKQERKVQLLHGMGGVGKTQVALEYAYKHKNEYSTVIWLDATTPKVLSAKCRDMLAIYSDEDVSGIERTRDLITAFHRFISRQTRWLLILDNADYFYEDAKQTKNYQAFLMDFMPRGNGHILITTRQNRTMEGITGIRVDIFNPDLAVRYLESRTGLNQHEEAAELGKRLGYLPLALEYASAYINVQHISFRDYLDRWEQYGTVILDKDYLDKTVRQTFHLTLDKIKGETEESKCTLFLLRRLSCIKSDAIPLDAYLAAVKEHPDAPLDNIMVYKDPNGEERVSILNGRKQEYYFLAGTRPDDSLILRPEESSSQTDPVVFKPKRFHQMLSDKLIREELIRKLTEYSLIKWDGENIVMHPLLKEIVFDEMTSGEKTFLYSSSETEALISRMYGKSGEAELALKFREQALHSRLKIFEQAVEFVNTEEEKKILQEEIERIRELLAQDSH